MAPNPNGTIFEFVAKCEWNDMRQTDLKKKQLFAVLILFKVNIVITVSYLVNPVRVAI